MGTSETSIPAVAAGGSSPVVEGDDADRFRALVDAVEDYAIVLLDGRGGIVSWNRGAVRMTGWPQNRMIGQPWAAVFPLEDAAHGAADELLVEARDQGRARGALWQVRHDGTRFWAEVAVTLLPDRSGFSVVVRDDTARRQMDQQLVELVERERRSRSRAEQLMRMRDQFIGTVSHELRTPLTSILGWTSVLKSRVNDATVAHGVEVIERNARHQTRLVENLIELSRLLEGKIRLEPRAVEPREVIDRAILEVKPFADARGVIVQRDILDPGAMLLADPARLQQVLWNLLSNAIKFSAPRGRVLVEVEVELDAIAIDVSDEGEGIAPEFLPYLFDFFSQADSSPSRRHPGLGIGLATVRAVVELHGGSVLASSDGVGRGATFTVRLPMSGRPPSAPRPQTDGETRELDGLKILLVEDEPEARELLAALLGDRGATVRGVGSAREALETAGPFAPDVLVSDIGMAGEDGYHLIRELRRRAPEEGGAVPAIALTGYTRPKDRAGILDAGYQMHVSKPADPWELVASITRLVRGSTNAR